MVQYQLLKICDSVEIHLYQKWYRRKHGQNRLYWRFCCFKLNLTALTLMPEIVCDSSWSAVFLRMCYFLLKNVEKHTNIV